MLKNFVAVDVETTGLDFDTESIVELAGVRFEAGKPVAEFQALISPGKIFTAMAKLLTGFKPEDFEKALPAEETLKSFSEFVGELPLVAHNADFDSRFVRRAIEKENLPKLVGPWIDTLLLSRVAWPHWESHRLEHLAARLGFPENSNHRALPDALRAGLLLMASQQAIATEASESTAGFYTLCVREMPGWSDVFSNSFSESPLKPPHYAAEKSAILQTTAPRHSEAHRDIVDSIASNLREDKSLVLQLNASCDELDIGLQSALEASSSGHVLLVAPDVSTWKELRRRYESSLTPSKPSVFFLEEPRAYLNSARLKGYLENVDSRLPVEERLAILPLISIRARGFSGSMVQGRGFSPERYRLLWSRVQCDKYEDDSDLKSERAKADSAKVVVVTQAAFLTHLRLEGALLPTSNSVILLGAHTLLDFAPRFFGNEVTFFRLRNILQLLRQSEELPIGLMQDSTDATIWFEPDKLFQRFLQKIARQAAKRRLPGDTRMRYSGAMALAFDVNPEPLFAAIKRNEEWLQTHRLSESPNSFLSDGLMRIETRLREFRLELEKLCEASDESQVYWVEDFSNPHKAVIRSSSLNLTDDFGTRFQNLFSAAVFISKSLAMISEASKADFFLRALGLRVDNADTHIAAKRLKEIQPPRFLLAPFSPAATNDGAAEFARFLTAAVTPFISQGVFLLFPSMGFLRTTALELQNLLPLETPLWAQHLDGGRDALLQLFASQVGGVVLATEGISGLLDLQKNAPKLIVIVRIPLPSLREPYFEARGEILRADGKNPKQDGVQPVGIVRLQKEFGALGGNQESSVVWFVDSRACADGLGVMAAKALGCEPKSTKDLTEMHRLTTEYLSQSKT